MNYNGRGQPISPEARECFLKLFDVVGAVVVTAWVALAGYYVYQVESAKPTDTRGMGDELVMQEGETWLILSRNDSEVGYVHQTRTEVGNGWLFEYDMLLAIQILGAERAIETTVKARLDEAGYLEKFNASVTASDNTFEASGYVADKTIHTTLDLGTSPRKQTIALEQRPRLSTNATNQLLAAGKLEAGEEFEERYFDPTTMQMTRVVMTYQGRKEIEVYGEKTRAHHVVQRMSGTELDVYVDNQGDILIQEFPLRIIGARLPAAVARSRVASIRRRVKEQRREKKRKGKSKSALDLGLDTARKVLGGQFEIEKPGSDDAAASKPDAGQSDADQPDAGQPDAAEAAPSRKEADDSPPTAPKDSNE